MGKTNKRTQTHPAQRREGERPARRVTGEQSLSQSAWRKVVAAIRTLAKPKPAAPRISPPAP